MWVDRDRCWWSACDSASRLTEIDGLERHCGACDGCGVDGVLVMELLGFDWEKEEETRGRKERGNSKEITKKKQDKE